MSSITLRFLAEASATHSGGKVRAGTVMKWIDEAAYACASGWAKADSVAVYVGALRFAQPVRVGDLVEVEARLAITGNTSMGISVEVRSGDLKLGELQTTTECLVVFVGVDPEGRPLPVETWQPETPGEVALAQHARTALEAARHAGASSH